MVNSIGCALSWDDPYGATAARSLPLKLCTKPFCHRSWRTKGHVYALIAQEAHNDRRVELGPAQIVVILPRSCGVRIDSYAEIGIRKYAAAMPLTT
jgi:hypothetical protein